VGPTFVARRISRSFNALLGGSAVRGERPRIHLDASFLASLRPLGWALSWGFPIHSPSPRSGAVLFDEGQASLTLLWFRDAGLFPAFGYPTTVRVFVDVGLGIAAADGDAAACRLWCGLGCHGACVALSFEQLVAACRGAVADLVHVRAADSPKQAWLSGGRGDLPCVHVYPSGALVV
jgi:hypothetical protein